MAAIDGYLSKAEKRADAVLVVEKAVVAAAASDLIADVARIRALIEADKLDEARAAILALSPYNPERAALAGLYEAYRLGLDQAAALTDLEPDKIEKIAAKLPAASIIEPVVGLDALVADALEKARKLAAGDVDVETALAPLQGAATSTTLRIETALNLAANDAALKVARSSGLPLVWIAERDACLHCLAMQGQVVKPGQPFDFSATFAAKPTPVPPWGPKRPPRHGRCRCRVEPMNHASYAEALRREAERSVLRGYSLPSESAKARVDAAQRLLEEGTTLPKSVQAAARTAVKAGGFSSRGVPSGSNR